MQCSGSYRASGQGGDGVETAAFFKDFIYLFIEREREREREAETQAEGEGVLHAGDPMWDLILGFQDHALD